jgi:hypothetical protein
MLSRRFAPRCLALVARLLTARHAAQHGAMQDTVHVRTVDHPAVAVISGDATAVQSAVY